MAELYRLPIETTPQALLEEAAAEMEALVSEWDPALGEYEMMLFQAVLWRLVWPLMQLASSADLTIFNEWGRQVIGIVPQEATRATVTSTWKVKDTAGYTIKAGTQVDIARSGDERFGFLVTEAVEIPTGKEETEAGEVILEAAKAGLEYNGLEGEGILVDALDYVTTVTIVGTTANGADAEDPRRYLGRLAETMQTYIEGVVIARDVEIVARNVEGIGRATAIDNYDAELEEDEQEKTTTVAVTDLDGEPASAEAKETLEEVLEEKREVNYKFYVVDATYHSIDVEGTIVPTVGYDKPTAIANAEAAIEEFLDPATHGRQPPGDESSWVNIEKLRYQDLVTVVNNAEGVDHYGTLKWRKAAEAFATTDITLSGIAPLPKPDAITIT